MNNKDYEKLDFSDDFMFCKVLSANPDITKELLELILDVEISRIKFPEAQKSIETTSDGRGIRLDVYLKDDEHTVYDIEMQTTKQKDLPKRTRYYQGMIDLNLIQRGSKFSELNKSYVIFICLEDIFGSQRCKYTFENLCVEDPTIHLNDESTKVFVTPVGDRKGLSEGLSEFLDFISGNAAASTLTRQIEKAVEKARTREDWRDDYMTLNLIKLQEREEGRAEGRAEGIEVGRTDSMRSNVLALAENLHISVLEAMDYLNIPDEYRETVLSSLEEVH